MVLQTTNETSVLDARLSKLILKCRRSVLDYFLHIFFEAAFVSQRDDQEHSDDLLLTINDQTVP